MKELSESNNNNELYELKMKKQNIYDKITLSSKSKRIVILRTMIISLCCFFFPLEVVVDNRLQEIDMNLYNKNKILSSLSKKLINSSIFQSFIYILSQILGSKESIMIYISLIYSIVHPFIGLKLIFISNISLYFVILLQILFQAHRPSWDLDHSETICRNTYPNPSTILFYFSFFYLYSIISFNLLKKKKFLPLTKLIIFLLYVLFLIFLLIMFGGSYLLYIHQIIYTFIISIVVIALLIDLDTAIHNFIFNSLRNVYNTRVYKMKIFFYVCSLFFIGFISLYFIEENDINKIKEKIRQKSKCTDDDIEMFGIKQGLLNISFLSGVVGAFWGASFTVEKKVGKWWSKRSIKKSIFKIIFILIVSAIFILIKYFDKKIKSKFEIYFTLEAILDFLECYFIFGPLTLFFQYMGFNEKYSSKKYEKINVNLRDEEDIQFYRASIFENEKKRKISDGYIVIDREDANQKDKNLDNIKGNEDNENKNEKLNNIYEEKVENEDNEENDYNENNEIYQPTSMIIKNVKKHRDEEADFEFYNDNENKNTQNLIENKNDLNDEE